MEHSTTGDLADYVRGLVAADRAIRLRSHLDACGRCAARAAAYERVREAGAAEAELAPPDWAVRSVRAVFAAQHVGRDSLEKLRLVFDSALASMAAGARSGEPSSRQLLFQSEDYGLELRIDPPSDGDGDAAFLLGLFLERPQEPQAYAPVQLVAGGRIAAAGATDAVGAFRFECPETEALELRLWPGEGPSIGVTFSRGRA